MAAHASSESPNTAAWVAAAALAETCAGRNDEAWKHFAEYSRRSTRPAMWFARAAAAVASAAAFGLGATEVAARVREVMPPEPDAAVLVGLGGALLGPVWTGLSAWTLDDVATARRDLTAALAFSERAGWPPWAAAARQCHAALDDLRAPLPLGLRR